MVEEPTIFFIRAEVEAPVQPQKAKASSTTVCLSLRPPYLASITAKPYLVGYIVPNFQKFEGCKGNSREHIARFIDLMGLFAHDAEICLREFSKSLTDRAYT